VAGLSDGLLVVAGILPQGFEQYARRLSRETRDEWANVQGLVAGFSRWFSPPASPSRSPARGAITCRSPPNGIMTSGRFATTRSRSFRNELCGRLERRKSQLVTLNARNPANELSDVLVI
jgi:hypothetical protein